jgi:Flp pilus assembly protein TadG
MVAFLMVKRGLAGRLDRGAVAVEFAIVLFWLVLLVMGAIDFGYFLYVKEVVTNAAREGARAGSVVSPTNSSLAASTACDTTTAYLKSGLGLTTVAPSVVKALTVNVTSTNTSMASTPAIQVTVQYPVGSLTGFLKPWLEDATSTKSARATAIMRWQ